MKKLLLAGGAGLVGQHLLHILDKSRYEITVIDKDKPLIKKLKKQFINIKFISADLSNYKDLFGIQFKFDILVILQAQIKGLNYDEFYNNSVVSTKNLIKLIKLNSINPYVVHISSSVINSKADDFYTRSKREQEQIIRDWIGKKIILRPTLMYGEGDNKHFFVLLKLMSRFHFFPLPGNGNYIRQPLYAADFAYVISDCLDNTKTGIFNISGLELLTFKDCLLKFKKNYKILAFMVPFPIYLFRLLLRLISFFLKKPPFTEQQLDALIIPEIFERIDWPKMFNTKYTKFDEGIKKFEYRLK